MLLMTLPSFVTPTFEAVKEQLRSVLPRLSERERRVIQLRFGLTGGHPMTLIELERELGMTRKDIRQIESKAFADVHWP
jgi:RNA polymerase primary sigma factor